MPTVRDSESDGMLPDDTSEYCPVSSASSDESISSEESEEKKIIVFESQLDELFKVCQLCGCIIDSDTDEQTFKYLEITVSGKWSSSWQFVDSNFHSV